MMLSVTSRVAIAALRPVLTTIEVVRASARSLVEMKFMARMAATADDRRVVAAIELASVFMIWPSDRADKTCRS